MLVLCLLCLVPALCVLICWSSNQRGDFSLIDFSLMKDVCLYDWHQTSHYHSLPTWMRIAEWKKENGVIQSKADEPMWWIWFAHRMFTADPDVLEVPSPVCRGDVIQPNAHKTVAVIFSSAEWISTHVQNNRQVALWVVVGVVHTYVSENKSKWIFLKIHCCLATQYVGKGSDESVWGNKEGERCGQRKRRGCSINSNSLSSYDQSDVWFLCCPPPPPPCQPGWSRMWDIFLNVSNRVRCSRVCRSEEWMAAHNRTKCRSWILFEILNGWTTITTVSLWLMVLSLHQTCDSSALCYFTW